MKRRRYLRAATVSGAVTLAGCIDTIQSLGGEDECGPGTVSIEEIRAGQSKEGIVDLKGEVTEVLRTNESTGVRAVRLNDSTGDIRVEFRKVEPVNPETGECISISGEVATEDGDRIIVSGLVE